MDTEAIRSPEALSRDALLAAYRALSEAYLARGEFIIMLMVFANNQEGDLGLCEARKDLAVGLLQDVGEVAR